MHAKRILFFVILVAALTAGCSCGDDDGDDAADDDAADDDQADDDTAADDLIDDDAGYDYFENFESYAPGGPPGGGWDVSSLSAGATALVAALSKDGFGQVLVLADPTEAAAGSAIAPIDELLLAQSFQLNWDWLWASGDGMSLQLLTPEGAEFPWVGAIEFYEGQVEAIYRSGNQAQWMTCVDAVELGVWYAFAALVNPSEKTYGVYVGGEPTACADLPFLADNASISAIGLTMYNNLAGGVTQLDNIGIRVTE